MAQPDGTEYDSKNFGQFFDWVHGGTPGGFHVANSRGSKKRMDISSNHRKINGAYRSGGEWLSHKTFYNRGGNKVTVARPGWGKAYEGTLETRGDGFSLHLSKAETGLMMQQLRQKGSEAWNAMRPDEPEFSLALSVAELREVPSMLRLRLRDLIRKIRNAKRVQNKRRFDHRGLHKRYANKQLEMQFGWLPLLSDIQSFTEVFNLKHKLLAKLIIDESKPLHRSSQISSPKGIDTEIVTNYSNAWGDNLVSPTFVTQCYPSNYRARKTVKFTEEYETWCVGQFRFLLPGGPRTEGWKREMYRRIMGGRLTPSLVYNLIPWSWLADYFTDLGQFIDAISPGVADKLICDYAYLMRTVKTRRRVDTKVGFHKKVSKPYVGNYSNSYLEVTSVTKMRVKASPFGFGLKEQDLTPQQIGILGHLGLSRLP